MEENKRMAEVFGESARNLESIEMALRDLAGQDMGEVGE